MEEQYQGLGEGMRPVAQPLMRTCTQLCIALAHSPHWQIKCTNGLLRRPSSFELVTIKDVLCGQRIEMSASRHRRSGGLLRTGLLAISSGVLFI